jgi:F-type H+-transporting ATPase subunit gamma|tara:strand:+ start:931 stop:1812 length:882 start_codon:yes stop_codon:yes gene_type:complete
MRSVKATKKITKAMELISASRIVKAQQRVTASTPYAMELTRAVSAVASYSSTNHPLTTQSENPRRAAILIISADRGMAGAYSTNAIKEGEKLAALLRERGLQVSNFLVGRKAVNYYKFRNREMAGAWTGFSDNPTYEDAKKVADALLSAFLEDAAVTASGVDEIHIIYTEFKSMLTQDANAKRMLPLEVVESSAPVPSGLLPMYEFEPNPAEVLNALLPRYIQARIFNAMLQSAASEHAARRRAMKSATDNAEDLIKSLTRLANAARQAEITQEISEIVGGADALASASAGSE